MNAIPVTSSISIDSRDTQFEFVLSTGPGGQNVNKVSTAAQLHYNPLGIRPLPTPVFLKLRTLAGSRMRDDGVVVITARRFRSQEQNRRDALERLCALISQAAFVPRPRKKTRPTRASKTRRVDHKRMRGEIKAMRGAAGRSEE